MNKKVQIFVADNIYYTVDVQSASSMSSLAQLRSTQTCQFIKRAAYSWYYMLSTLTW